MGSLTKSIDWNTLKKYKKVGVISIFLTQNV